MFLIKMRVSSEFCLPVFAENDGFTNFTAGFTKKVAAWSRGDVFRPRRFSLRPLPSLSVRGSDDAGMLVTSIRNYSVVETWFLADPVTAVRNHTYLHRRHVQIFRPSNGSAYHTAARGTRFLRSARTFK